MTEFRMPALGADMESGTVVEWLVAPGDTVQRGDVVAVVDTDKAAIDIECFDSGVVERLLVEPGQRVTVGTPLAVIGTTATAPEPTAPEPTAPEPTAPEPTAPEPAALEPATPVAVTPPSAAPVGPLAVHSPLVRRVAAEAGVDIATVRGTGSGGAVSRADVERAALAAAASPVTSQPLATDGAGSSSGRPRVTPYARRLAAERGLDLATVASPDRVLRARDLPIPAEPRATPALSPEDRMRAATAALMVRSKREIPHYYLSAEFDMGGALDWLRQHNREIPVPERVLPAAVLLRAVALAAQAVPELNGHWLGDRFVPGNGVHLGVAVSLRNGGLSAPVIHNAEELGLDALMAQLRALAERARAGRLRSSEVTGATITVTNLGELGVDVVNGVIYPPQVALVGFGAVRKRPWADRETVTVSPVVTASLSADHRATDGATGARFLHEIDRRLKRPKELS